jgi:hypothetical protein
MSSTASINNGKRTGNGTVGGEGGGGSSSMSQVNLNWTKLPMFKRKISDLWRLVS